jgi:hypothetical protein
VLAQSPIRERARFDKHRFRQPWFHHRRRANLKTDMIDNTASQVAPDHRLRGGISVHFSAWVALNET